MPKLKENYIGNIKSINEIFKNHYENKIKDLIPNPINLDFTKAIKEKIEEQKLILKPNLEKKELINIIHIVNLLRILVNYSIYLIR